MKVTHPAPLLDVSADEITRILQQYFRDHPEEAPEGYEVDSMVHARLREVYDVTGATTNLAGPITFILKQKA